MSSAGKHRLITDRRRRSMGSALAHSPSEHAVQELDLRRPLELHDPVRFPRLAGVG